MGSPWSKSSRENKSDAKEQTDGQVSRTHKKKEIRALTFVGERLSSLFRDSDGDVASEFYVEVMSSQGHATKKRWTFRKVTSNLQPVGEVKLKIPRIHYDCPAILIDLSYPRTVTNK